MIGKVVLHADHVSKMLRLHPRGARRQSSASIRRNYRPGGRERIRQIHAVALLAGVEPPDSGTIFMGPDQVGVPSRGLAHSAKLGVGVVFQELALIPNLRVFENFFLLAPN